VSAIVELLGFLPFAGRRSYSSSCRPCRPRAGSVDQVREPASPVRGRGVPGQRQRRRLTPTALRHLVACLRPGWPGTPGKNCCRRRWSLLEPLLPRRRSSFRPMTNQLNSLTMKSRQERPRTKPVHHIDVGVKFGARAMFPHRCKNVLRFFYSCHVFKNHF